MKLNDTKTWIAGASAFIGIFGTLCVPFDPIIAFALTLVAIAVLKN
jgi:hypothetical protein